MINYVIGISHNEQQVAEVVGDLKNKGYTTEKISVIAKKENISEITQVVKFFIKDGPIAGVIEEVVYCIDMRI